ncbi:MAG: hypothetical protein ACRD2S_01810 [Terriglobales bacterium]
MMELLNSNVATSSFFYRCAGPGCGVLKQNSDRWWLIWTSFGEFNRPVLYLCSWDEEIAAREGTLYVCGELCAQRLQSQFMGNIREGQRDTLAVSGKRAAQGGS